MGASTNDGFYARVDNYGLMEVYGPDALRFLQAQTTNDLHDLAEYSSQMSCLLDRKAHIEAYFQIYRKHNSYRILAEKSQIAHILKHLDQYRFADKVEFVDLTAGGTFFAIEGPRARSVIDAGMLDNVRLETFVHYVADISLFHCPVHLFRKPLIGAEGYFLWVPNCDAGKLESALKKICKQFGLHYLDENELEHARIEIGVPKFGVDFDSSNFLPETGLEEKCVSYTKGCFLGQEVLARVRSQGSPIKGLMGLIFPDNMTTQITHESKVMVHDKQVAWIKSNCFSKTKQRTVALAYVARDFRVPNTKIKADVDGVSLELSLVSLPFYQPETRESKARKLYEQALQVFAKEDESTESSESTQNMERSTSKNTGSSSIDLLREALELDPFLEDAYESLGVILSKRNQLEEAIIMMQRLAELNPESVMAHTNLSVFYLEKGLKEQAEEEKAISMSIRMKIAARQAVSEMQEKEQKEDERAAQLERLKMFEQVLKIDSDDLLANYGAGSCFTALGKFSEAIPLLEKAIQVKPTHSVSYLSLGLAYEGLENWSKAKDTYTEGIAVASKRGDMQPMQEMQNRLASLKVVSER